MNTRESKIISEWEAQIDKFKRFPNIENQDYWMDKINWYASQTVKQERGGYVPFGERHQLKLFEQFIAEKGTILDKMLKSAIDTQRSLGVEIDGYNQEIALSRKINAIINKIEASQPYDHLLSEDMTHDKELLHKVLLDKKDEIYQSINREIQNRGIDTLPYSSYGLYKLTIETCPELIPQLTEYLLNSRNQSQSVQNMVIENSQTTEQNIQNQITEALIEKCKQEHMHPIYTNPEKCDISNIKVGDDFIYDGVVLGKVVDCAEFAGVSTFIVDYVPEPNIYGDEARFLFSTIDCTAEYIKPTYDFEQYYNTSISTCGELASMTDDELKQAIQWISSYHTLEFDMDAVFADVELTQSLKYALSNMMFADGMDRPDDLFKKEYLDNEFELLQYELVKAGHAQYFNFADYTVSEIKEMNEINREI